ncbi:hypothetical protein N9E38_00380 [Yoonia sp.]|uniref:hypothetical protein n=1 Tax=Yoonia sp. TaxID=2212373 RepID=UPI002324E9B3|nr:hypothetical protein [Yoonia sp.]MDA9979876.1 hypothetical protein [Yoonia sp.]MDC1399393.1 hypothetical protein [Yoonia sp.]
MTLGDILLGFLIACGFFVSALVSRMFRRRLTGVIIGGVVGLAFAVTILVYGINNVFATGQAGLEN